MKKNTRIIITIFVFIIISGMYEYYVHTWSIANDGPIIRLDIVMIYPIILTITALAYYFTGKLK